MKQSFNLCLAAAIVLAAPCARAAIGGVVSGTPVITEMPVGANLSQVASNAVPGTVLRLRPGIYDIGTNHIRLPHGVSLVGAGRDVTFIVAGGALQTNGVIVNLGSTSTVQNVTILGTNATVYQAAVGCAVYNGQAFTNATVVNCRLQCDSDVFYVNTNALCTLDVIACTLRAKWDATVLQGTANHWARIFSSTVEANLQGAVLADAVASGNASCVNNSGNGRIDFYACTLTATNANAAQIVNIAGTTAKANFYACTWQAAGTNTGTFCNASALGVVNVNGTEVTRANLGIGGATNVIGSVHYMRYVSYLTNSGLSFMADDPDEFTVNQPIFFSPLGGINVGSTNEPGVNISAGIAGAGFKVKEGANCTMGTGALSSGAATVSTTAVKTNSRIMVTSVATSGAGIACIVSNIIAGTSFRVHAVSGTPATRFDWILFNPAP